jgi:Bacteriophage Mu Gam like protein
MDNAVAATTREIVPVNLETPPVTSPVDAEVDVEVLKTVPKQFAIEDEKSANWLVRKITNARAYAERVKAFAEQELRRAEREERTLLFLFGRQIEMWAKSQIEKLHNRKSLSLPGGEVGYRTIAPKLVIDNEEFVLAWARQNCQQAVIVTENLSKSKLNEYFKTTGSVPEGGAHVEPEMERFYIK